VPSRLRTVDPVRRARAVDVPAGVAHGFSYAFFCNPLPESVLQQCTILQKRAKSACVTPPAEFTGERDKVPPKSDSRGST